MIKTIEEAQALVGTTWERDGRRREITAFRYVGMIGDHIHGDVYWKRPGGKERFCPIWLPHFEIWLSKATKVLSNKSLQADQPTRGKCGKRLDPGGKCPETWDQAGG